MESNRALKDVAIYGAGGFGREVACLIKKINEIEPQWNFIGFFDDGLKAGSANEYGCILGGMDTLNSRVDDLSLVLAIGNPKTLTKILEGIKNKALTFPNIIAPDMLFLDQDSVSMGQGNIIGFKSVISSNVHLGDFNIFNTDVIVGHDTRIGSFNMFNPSTRISGEVTIGNCNFFGVGSTVLQQNTIRHHTTVGANSVIIKNTKDNTTYIGNPATAFKY